MSVSLSKKSLLIPLALAAGWTLLGAVNGIGWAFKGNSPAAFILKWELVDYGLAFLVSLLLFLTYSRLQRRLGSWPFALLAAILCFAFGIMWRLLFFWTAPSIQLMKAFQPDLKTLLIRGGLMDGTTLGTISLLYFAIHHWRQLVEQREKARQATALAHQAQLQMLRYQLNPHFLFNALNSIRAMIVEDQERSRQMVTELAEFLRYSLDGNEEESTIGDEIQAIENYLAIQRIRFEERLEATVHVDAEAHEFAVPCFLIHPLVENAVKYGMQTSQMPLRVNIEVSHRGTDLAIRVSNTGRLLERPENHGATRAPDGAGIGIKNIAQRLKLVFPNRHNFKMWESEGWVRAEILIQLEPQERRDEKAPSAHRG